MLKILRAIESVLSNLSLAGAPIPAINTAVRSGTGTIGFVIGWASAWVTAAVRKLIVYAIDKHDEKEVISEVKEVIERLESLREKIDDEKTIQKLDNDIERMKENLNKLQS